MKSIFTIILLVVTVVGYCNSVSLFGFNTGKKQPTCGYESCPVSKADELNVHIVPHTHDDVGWLKTVDQYYYGSKSNIQKAGVQYILDSVVRALNENANRRFIYVESAFFFKWWKAQTNEIKDIVKTLVNEGRLEFIGGAWSMNDEATTHYQSTVDQFSWGLRQLFDTFGKCGRPRIGWQIDPFGHSREMASMFAQMGYDGLFFGRLDYEDKQVRLLNKTAEMIWHGSANLGEQADLFTGVLFNNYGPPPGFCFDILCQDEPIIDDRHSRDYNVKERVGEFLDYVRKQSKFYRTNNIILTMGGDFTYMDAEMYFKNMDLLIRYANNDSSSKINLFYSTPSCYLKSLHDAAITWPEKSDDFFPYASDPHAFWTGYFTSRPTLKRFERNGNHFLQVCKQLTARASKEMPGFSAHMNYMREVMGIMQHHDAVTGTEKQHVANDYATKLNIAFRACGMNTKHVLNQLTTFDTKSRAARYVGLKSDKLEFDFFSCYHLNISMCEVSESGNNFIVTLYNPLARSTYQYVRVPIPDSNYKVDDYRGVPTAYQIVSIPDSLKKLPQRISAAQYELVFFAVELPPLGYKSYYITHTGGAKEDAPEVKTSEEVVIGNKHFSVKFGSDGILSEITIDGESSKLTQQFYYYDGASGDNKEFLNRSSGAYIFRPNSTLQLVSSRALLSVVKGDLVDEVRQVFSDWVSQVIRVYKEENYIEFEWMVGPIPVDDGIGKEVVTRFSTDIRSEGVFYTDSNGREMLKRVRNFRPTWNLKLDEKVAGNYYPVTSRIAIDDGIKRMAVLNDRAQGGTSLVDGSVDLMIHRRLLHDDAFGVAEALNEEAFGKGLVARGKHYVVFGMVSKKSPTLKAQERFLQIKVLLPGFEFFSNAIKYSYADWMERYTHIYSGMSLSLPLNIHLLSFEPWRNGVLLMRFEHILEKNEDPIYSKMVSFNLKDIFNMLDITDIQETTLDGNQLLSETNRMKFKADSGNDLSSDINEFEFEPKIGVEVNNLNTDDSDKYKIDLKPMQIRTFVVFINEPL